MYTSFNYDDDFTVNQKRTSSGGGGKDQREKKKNNQKNNTGKKSPYNSKYIRKYNTMLEKTVKN